MPICGRLDIANWFTVAQNQLAAPQHGVRVLEDELHEAARNAILLLLQKGRFAGELLRLVECHSKRKASLKRSVFRAQLMPPGAVALFHAQGLKRVVAGVGQAVCLAGCHKVLIQLRSDLDRDIKLPPQLSDIGQPRRADSPRA